MKIVFLTGSGISHPSGIPTFRGNNGIWNGREINEVATMSAFISDPEEVINFMNELSLSLSDKKPNKAHYAIANLEKEYDVTVITQNIDTLHEKSGSTNVIHLHGRHDENKCLKCGIVHKNENEQFQLKYLKDICPKCSSTDLKHNIVLFEESLNFDDFDYAYSEVYNADLFVQIGTSSLVQPANRLSEHAKPRRKRVEMNLSRTYPKNIFKFQHYYLGNIIDTIDQFVSDIPKMLPVCSREEMGKFNIIKDKDRYVSKKIVYNSK